MMAGKDSKSRPLSVPRKQLDENWEKNFGKNKQSKNSRLWRN